jgi:iron complex transport system permease protein
VKLRVFWLLLLSVSLILIALLSLGVGAVAIAPSRVFDILRDGRQFEASPVQATIIWDLRLPRICLASLVGAALGTAGAGYQGLFRNPLADPFVIGASSGAALGATIVIVSGAQLNVLGVGAIPAAALVGSLLAVAAVYFIAFVGRQGSILTLLLAGVATSSFIGAIVSLLMFLHDEQLITIFGWLMGSLSGRGWQSLRMTTPLITVGIVWLWLLARPLDALTFGEETASSLGVRLGWLKAMVIFAATLSTAAGVAAAGIIGFIGLISPHVARFLVGARHAVVIPASGLIGAMLLLVADDVARVVAAPAELPVGVITALMGGPFFLSLLKLRQRELGGIG